MLEKTKPLNHAVTSLEHVHSATLDALSMALDFRDQSKSVDGLKTAITAAVTRDAVRELGLAPPPPVQAYMSFPYYWPPHYPEVGRRAVWNPRVISMRRCQPSQSVLTPGSPSPRRARKPPSWAIQRTVSRSVGGSSGGVGW